MNHEIKIITAHETKFNALHTDVAPAAESATFDGYGSVFNVTDSVNDMIVPGAFAASLARWAQRGTYPPLLWQHDMTQPIGHWQVMVEDEKGLRVKGTLFVDDIPRAKEAQKLLHEKVVTGLSIGYRTIKSYRDPKTGVRMLTEVDLIEVSMVTFPANDAARISPRAPALPDDIAIALTKTIRRATEELKAEMLYNAITRATAEIAAEMGYKFDASQPRALSGTSNGGEWVDTGRGFGGGGSSRSNSGTPSSSDLSSPRVMLPIKKPNHYDPTASNNPDAIRPVYPVETALAALSGPEVGIVATRIAARAAGRVVQNVGAHVATYQSEARITRAAKAIEEHLGDHAPVIRNKNGDHVFMNKAGDKKVRFDINKTSGDKPHFQIEKRASPPGARKEEWADAGNKHRYHFKE